MEKQALPTFIVLSEAAKQSERVSGNIPVASLPRLTPHLIQDKIDKANIDLDLQIGKDKDSVVFFTGKVQALLPMVCQRCLMPSMITVETAFSLTPINEENDHNSSAYEGFVTENNRLFLASLVEEEILLNLPLIPKHAEGQCHLPQEEVEGVESTKRNPFEQLKILYNK